MANTKAKVSSPSNGVVDASAKAIARPVVHEDANSEEEVEEEIFIESSDEPDEEENEDDGLGDTSSSEDETETRTLTESNVRKEPVGSKSRSTKDDDGEAPAGNALGPHDHLSDQEYTDSDEENERNTIGNVPLHWYDDFDHIGYDKAGKPIVRSKKMDAIDKVLASRDDPFFRRTVYDPKNDESTVLTDRELVMVRRMLQSKFPELGLDAEPEYVDYYTRDRMIMPLSSTPEPKRRFIPSKWERMKVLKIVQGIKEGRIKVGKPPKKEKQEIFLLWGEDDQVEDASRKRKGPKHIPAPKVTPPGHALSYRPPPEYLFDENEEKEWNEAEPEDRKLSVMPKQYDKLRAVPRHEDFVKEAFERCLDLYLCARTEKQRLNIDPESLVPTLPEPQELRPYPTTLAMTYYGHHGHVYTVAVDPSGHLLASGGKNGVVRIWEVDTGKCLCQFNACQMVSRDSSKSKTTKSIASITKIVWNPQSKYKILAVAVGDSVVLCYPGVAVCTPEDADQTVKLLCGSLYEETDTTTASKPLVEWREIGKHSADQVLDQKLMATVMHLQGGATVNDLAWHAKGEYLATTAAEAQTKTTKVVVHHIAKRHSQNPFSNSAMKGRIQRVLFHPSKPIFFLATQTHVLVYHLLRQIRLKKLTSGAKWISSIAIHPKGDNLIVGTYDRRVCWFDLDLSDKPFKTLKYHTSAVRDVDFHKRYPLFSTASDDGTVHIFHGRVYDDLMTNPLIVPLKTLKCHEKLPDGLGVLGCTFHPSQPWVFTCGADGAVRMYQNLI